MSNAFFLRIDCACCAAAQATALRAALSARDEELKTKVNEMTALQEAKEASEATLQQAHQTVSELRAATGDHADEVATLHANVQVAGSACSRGCGLVS